ncbi:MAG: nitrogenase molybdenum-iron protein subunit beta [Phycisphaerales bacterium]|nr:nitrogenase molybdenum-iron protein subunit beta [Phycisphaerales bacterium]
MLLRHTNTEVVEREALTINPAKTCQPVGAMYAALGIHGCLPHSHGSQGCCSYHRSTLTRHYKEPVMASTSSFTEGASVFGGQSNLLTAIETIFTVYAPDIIAVHTTCLSETIGDDIVQITAKATGKGLIPPGKYVIHANTPSYVGSHVTGFANMTKSMVTYFAQAVAEKKNKTVNILPGWVEPADMKEIRRLAGEMGVAILMYPDTSGVLDAPQTGRHEFYPRGGATVDQIRASGDSRITLALGPTASTSAAEALDSRCKVPFQTLELPIGLRATDRFINALRKAGKVEVPASINDERGRLVDMISDMQQYFFGKRAALWGDPDQLVSLAEFLHDLDMKPTYIVTGTPGRAFEERIATVLGGRLPEVKVRQGKQADMFLLHQWIKNEKVDLLIGNSYGKYIARDEDIPLVRHGFPILDRVGHQYFPTVGYRGAMRLCEQILNVLMDRQDRDSPEASFELVM